MHRQVAISELQKELAKPPESQDADRVRALQAVILVNEMFQFAGLVSTDGILLEANTTVVEAGGLQREDVIGKPVWETYWWTPDKRTATEVRDAILRATRGEMVRYDATVRMKGNQRVTIDFSAIPVLDDKGAVAFLVLEGRDIQKRKHIESQLESMANFDSVTGIRNRQSFLKYLQKTIERSSKNSQVGLLYIDLDNFKSINDSFGHDVGDSVLCQVAQRLSNVLRGRDTLGRIGGDEFAIVAENVSDAEDMEEIASRILDKLTGKFQLGERSLTVQASIGLSVSPLHGSESAVLLQHADAAMYEAKKAGRNQYAWASTDLTSQLKHRFIIGQQLREALETDRLALNYQPVWDLQRSAVVGLEALVRWPDQTHEFSDPEKFVSLASESDLILMLGDWVLNRAVSDFSSIPANLRGAVRLAVNVSARQIQNKNFVASVRNVLSKHSVRPEEIEIEITEDLLIEDADIAETILNELRDIGISIALDDFGTGYSSLACLKRFPIDKIKIDKEFIMGPQDMGAQSIARAIIALGEELGIAVVAEGVETVEQARFLADQGCPFAQGFYFVEPLSFLDARRLVCA